MLLPVDNGRILDTRISNRVGPGETLHVGSTTGPAQTTLGNVQSLNV
jgi:hypothetical protein